ncbi:MAG: hypothetical protein WC879_18230 [Melioribacteraceae bacterium]
MKKTIYLFTIVGLITACNNGQNTNTSTKTKESTYNQFALNYALENKALSISLNSDLPNDIEVILSVSRSYWEEGSSDEYSIDYISKKNTVGELRNGTNLLVDNSQWRSNLTSKQKELSSVGLGFDVSKISDNLEISAIVPLTNQPYPKFDNTNSVSDPQIISNKVKIHFPIKNNIEKKSKYAYYQSLNKNGTYAISNKTPLMPEFKPVDPMAAMSNVKYLQAGSRIRILSINHKYNNPWYEVNVINSDGKIIGRGWINSTALIGQDILVIK